MRVTTRYFQLCSALLIAFAAPTLAVADNWIGLGLGPNFSTVTNEQLLATDTLAGGNTEFQIGAFADWGLKDVWYLRTGFRYNTYGVGNSAGTRHIAPYSIDLHYLEIPVLIKPTLKQGPVHLYALAGPMFGFNVGSSVSGFSVSPTSFINTFNFSLDFGAGVEVPLVSNVLAFAQFDYALGLSNLEDSFYSGGVSYQTRGANLTFGAAMQF